MQDVLIALKTDLASGIAIRYVCQLEKLFRFNMQAVHIPDMDEKGHSPGGGWVHQTWEDAVIQQAKENIAKLVKEDLFYSYLTQSPKIIPGDKDQVILEEVNNNKYAFFIEGLLHSFDPETFFQKLDSDLYNTLAFPILLVKNIVNMDKGIQIAVTKDTMPSVFPWFFKIFKELSEKPDILICNLTTNDEKIKIIEDEKDLISDIKAQFSQYSKEVGKIQIAEGSAEELSLLVRDHALLISSRPKSHEPMAEMLSMSPCPILLCPESQL
jgi:hypothetical protein